MASGFRCRFFCLIGVLTLASSTPRPAAGADADAGGAAVLGAPVTAPEILALHGVVSEYITGGQHANPVIRRLGVLYERLGVAAAAESLPPCSPDDLAALRSLIDAEIRRPNSATDRIQKLILLHNRLRGAPPFTPPAHFVSVPGAAMPFLDGGVAAAASAAGPSPWPSAAYTATGTGAVAGHAALVPVAAPYPAQPNYAAARTSMPPSAAGANAALVPANRNASGDAGHGRYSSATVSSLYDTPRMVEPPSVNYPGDLAGAADAAAARPVAAAMDPEHQLLRQLNRRVQEQPGHTRLPLMDRALFFLFMRLPQEALVDWQRAGPESADDLGHSLVASYLNLATGQFEKSAEQLDEAVRRFDRRRSFRIVNPDFADDVVGYRCYESRPERAFAPGERVTVYLELEGVAMEEEYGGWRTRLSIGVHLYDEDRREILSMPNFGALTRRYSGPVREHNLSLYNLTLPAGMAVGRHSLHIVVYDHIRRQRAETILPMDVGGMGAAGAAGAAGGPVARGRNDRTDRTESAVDASEAPFGRRTVAESHAEGDGSRSWEREAQARRRENEDLRRANEEKDRQLERLRNEMEADRRAKVAAMANQSIGVPPW